MKKSVIILAAAWLVAACAPKEALNVISSKVFRASLEQSTRTYTENGKVCWYNGDAISIFDQGNSSSDNVKYTYDGEDGTTAGDFSTSSLVPVPSGNLVNTYGIYPYLSDNIVLGEGQVIAYIFPSQSYEYDSFGDRSNPMVAASADHQSLEFKNAAGYLNVRLYGDNSTAISSVRVESNNGEYIAGDVLVSIEPGEIPTIAPYPDNGYAVTAATVSFANLNNDVYLDASTPLDVWVALTPGTISSGIKVTVNGANGRSFEVSNTNPLTIKRGVCTPTAPLEVVFPAPETWHHAGTVDWTDAFLAPWFGLGPVTYTVDFDESDETPGRYRLVNVYGEANPYNEPGDWDDSKDYYIVINADDPDWVWMETSNTGVDWGYGFFKLSSYPGYAISDYGYTLDEAKADLGNYFGTMSGNVITFPEYSLLKGDDDGWANCPDSYTITLNFD